MIDWRSKLKKPAFLIPAAALGVFILLFFLGMGYFSWQFNQPLAGRTEAAKFSLQPGWGVEKITAELATAKLIKSALAFKLYIWQRGWGQNLQAGEYELAPNLSLAQIARQIKDGAVVDNSIAVTISPGQRLARVETIFRRAGFDHQSNLTDFVVADFAAQFPFLRVVPPQNNLEGFLYPETLKFFKDATGREIMEKILSVFAQNIDQNLLAAIAAKNMDFYQVLTLASIVEEEIPASRADDRKIVAGIFWKRLKNNYPLESCVTIEYVLGVHKARYSFADTRVASPYNTYINAGLPPTPINSPRRDAVEAVVFFQPSDYNFFLSDPQTGQTIFAGTLKEHNQNKNKYLN